MRKSVAVALGLSFAAAAGGCQLLAGLEDRSLARDDGAAAGAGAGGAGAGAAGTAGMGGAAGKAGTAGSAGAGGSAAGSAGKGGGGTSGGAGMDACMPAMLDGGAMPPNPPADGGKPTGGLSLFAAARRYFLGTVVPDPDPTKSKPDFTAWKQIGYDIDKLCTSVTGGSVAMASCVPVGTATNDLLTDGDACRDNAFGRFISEKLGLLSPEKLLNDKIENGAQTFLLQIDDIDPGMCDAHAPGRLYVAAATPMSPWQSATPRQVDSRSVCNDDLALPKMTFPNAYIVGDTWVSGPPGASDLTTYFPLGFTVVTLHAKSAVLTATLAADHQSIISSTLALVIDPKEMLEQFKPIALGLNNCNDPGQIVSAYVDSLLQYSDLVDVPGFVSPNKTCNLMSMGVGIAWTPVKPPSGVLVVPETPPPCPATGGGGGAGAGGAAGAGGGGAAGKSGMAGGGAAGASGVAGGGAAGASGAVQGGAGAMDCPPTSAGGAAGKAGDGGASGAAGKAGAAGASGTAGKGG